MKRALLASLAVALVAGPARADSRVVAEERVDVDGDGRADVIRLDESATVSVAIAGRRDAPWVALPAPGRRAVAGTITVGRGARFGGDTIIVATAELADAAGSSEWQAVVLRWRRGALEQLWTGAVGPQGRDGAFTVHVEATRFGLLRYQRRHGYERCDGAPVYLFPEAYDFSRRRFVPVRNAPRLPEDAPTLTANRTQPAEVAADAPATAFRARLASVHAGAADAGELVPPIELDDGDPTTAWREELGGDGRGEFVVARSSMPGARVAAVRIVPGDAADAASFRRANRLARVGLLVGDRTAYWVEFSRDPAQEGDGDFASPYWVTLPAPIEADCVTVVIDRLYPGGAAGGVAGRGETAISELAVLTELELSPGGAAATLAERVAAGGRGAITARDALVRTGARGAEALADAALASGRGEAERRRLRQALAHMRDPGAAPHLVASLAWAPLTDEDDALLVAALERLGGAAVPALAALLAGDDAGDEARTAAVTALGRIADPAAGDALLDAAGRGTRAQRARVTRALADRDAAVMPRLLRAALRAKDAGDVGREADLWRALGWAAARPEIDEGARAKAAQAAAPRLRDAAQYELRYRLYEAAPALGTAALDALAERLTAGASAAADEPEEYALRRVAATALGRAAAARPEVEPMLVELSGDPDPGVRLAAVSALAPRIDDARTERALVERLAADAWPQIRRSAAGALSRRCATAEPARALHQAVDGDADMGVRTTALASLVACRAPGIGDRLLALAADRRTPSAVREQSITLFGVAEDGRGRPLVTPGGAVAIFEQVLGEMWGSTEAVRLAQAAAAALGKLGAHPGAGDAAQVVVEPLLRSARDGTFPEVQAAAVRALGEMCAPEALPLFEELSGGTERVVIIAARGARSRCATPRR